MQLDKRTQWALIAVGVVFVLLTSAFTYYTLYLPSRTSTNATGSGQAANRPEEALELARKSLASDTKLAVCRQALQHMNDYLNRSSAVRMPQLTEAQREWLQKEFQLDKEELAEVTRDTYTPLDAHHLELCFLLRDGMRAVLAQEESAKPVPPSAEQAVAAFSWVIRQVHLLEPPQPSPPIPPQFVLRRGWGNAGERALVFLAALHQLRIPGCVVTVPEGNGQKLWACGALLDQGGTKQILLFDPRMGLPLPGPHGKGIATLAEASTQPEVLKQLTGDEKHPYDVTADLAARAEVHVASPLSALAPRMGFLESKLRDPDPDLKPPTVQVNLGIDGEALFRQFQQAAGKDKVKVAVGSTRALRSFLPPEESGIDRTGRQDRFKLAMVPWDRLPPQIRELPGEPRHRLNNIFGVPFVVLLTQPGSPRDQVLRGQFTEAAPALTQERDALRQQKDQIKPLPEDWEVKLIAWQEKIVAAHAQLMRVREKEGPNAPATREASARELEVWKEGGEVIRPLVLDRAVEPRTVQLTYLLALCKHEEAEQLQMRLIRHKNLGAGDWSRTHEAWKDARREWKQFIDDHSTARKQFADDHLTARATASARRWLAHAEARLNNREYAANLLEDLTGDLTDLEKVAHLYLACRMRCKE